MSYARLVKQQFLHFLDPMSNPIAKFFYFRKKFNLSVNPNRSITRLLIGKLFVFLEYVFLRFKAGNQHRKNLGRLKSMGKSNQRKIAVVLAAGPSLSPEFLKSLSKFRRNSYSTLEIFSVNFMPIKNDLVGELTDYLVLSDPVTNPASTHSDSKELWEWVSRSNCSVVVPTSWHKDLASLEVDESRIIYFNDLHLVGFTRNISPLRPRGYLSLTAYKALAIAKYIDYKKIGIIGFDNDQFRSLKGTTDNRLIQGSRHFEKYHDDVDLSHFYSNGICDYFYETSLVFLDLRRFMSSKIINLDETSLVDAFEKLNLDNFFVE